MSNGSQPPVIPVLEGSSGPYGHLHTQPIHTFTQIKLKIKKKNSRNSNVDEHVEQLEVFKFIVTRSVTLLGT